MIALPDADMASGLKFRSFVSNHVDVEPTVPFGVAGGRN